jgi:hypothetical protein
MYGYLHRDELEGYDFWGFCDIDVVFGDIRYFITDKVLENDVISSHSTRLAGHFSLFRNTPMLREAFRKVEGWEKKICDDKNHQFDEKDFSKLFIRYKNFPAWIRKYIPGYSKLKTKSYFKEFYSTPNCRIDWEDGSRNFPTEWYWERGILTNNGSAKPFMYFHFLYWKQNYWKPDYREENGHLSSGNAKYFSLNNKCEKFKIDKMGFHFI